MLSSWAGRCGLSAILLSLSAFVTPADAAISIKVEDLSYHNPPVNDRPEGATVKVSGAKPGSPVWFNAWGRDGGLQKKIAARVEFTVDATGVGEDRITIDAEGYTTFEHFVVLAVPDLYPEMVASNFDYLGNLLFQINAMDRFPRAISIKPFQYTIWTAKQGAFEVENQRKWNEDRISDLKVETELRNDTTFFHVSGKVKGKRQSGDVTIAIDPEPMPPLALQTLVVRQAPALNTKALILMILALVAIGLWTIRKRGHAQCR
jgi:hypothetical protein